jgi:WD40 repeat protein
MFKVNLTRISWDVNTLCARPRDCVAARDIMAAWIYRGFCVAIFFPLVLVVSARAAGDFAKPDHAEQAPNGDSVILAQEKHRFSSDRFFSNSATFSLDGKLLAACLYDANVSGWKIMVWESSSGKEVAAITIDRASAVCLAFTADGKKIMAGFRRDEGAIKTWDIATRRESASWDTAPRKVGEFLVGTGGVSQIAIHPDGQKIIVRTTLFKLEFRDANKGSVAAEPFIANLPAKTARGFSAKGVSYHHLALSRDGKMLVTCDSAKTVRLCYANTEIKPLTLETQGSVKQLFFNAVGDRVGCASSDGTVRFWNTKTGQMVTKISLDILPEDIAYSPDGNWLLLGYKGQISVRNTHTGAEVAVFKNVENPRGLTFSADGRLFAFRSASENSNSLRVWEFRVQEKK